MGMYTELLLKCEVKGGIDETAFQVLCHLFNKDPAPTQLPDHRFFGLPRWGHIGRACSFYHHPGSFSEFTTGGVEQYDLRNDGGYIFSRSDLKNYEGEIEAFLQWVHPYIQELDGKCIGWLWYEEWDCPKLLVMRSNCVEITPAAAASPEP